MASEFIFIHVTINGTPSRPPHFHAYYAEYEALINIRTLEIMAGELPGKQLKRVLKWAGLVQNELLDEFIRLQQL